MLEQLLNEIRNGGTLETAVLAARLGTSPELVSIMLEHLQRLGLIQPYNDCTGGCGGCALQEACSLPRSPRLWQTQTS